MMLEQRLARANAQGLLMGKTPFSTSRQHGTMKQPPWPGSTSPASARAQPSRSSPSPATCPTWSRPSRQRRRPTRSWGIEPMFPFGFGLSYTTFSIADVAVTGTTNDGTQPIVVQALVTNTGTVAGAEVVQVYLGVPSPKQPPKRLVGFAKVLLEPGDTKRVAITVDPSSTNHPLSVWSDAKHAFIVSEGDFIVTSARQAPTTPSKRA
jgi:hypothetical protein